MKIIDNEGKKEASKSDDKITIKTPVTTYSFSQSWVDNEDLNGILVGLIADDFNKQQFGDMQ